MTTEFKQFQFQHARLIEDLDKKIHHLEDWHENELKKIQTLVIDQQPLQLSLHTSLYHNKRQHLILIQQYTEYVVKAFKSIEPFLWVSSQPPREKPTRAIKRPFTVKEKEEVREQHKTRARKQFNY